jgi:hypothetical protein
LTQFSTFASLHPSGDWDNRVLGVAKELRKELNQLNNSIRAPERIEMAKTRKVGRGPESDDDEQVQEIGISAQA